MMRLSKKTNNIYIKAIKQLYPRKYFSTNPDNFLNGSNSVYVEQMYDSWLTDPKRYV